MAKVKIPSSGYYCNWQTNTLYMTYRFSVKTSDTDSDEFATYDKIIRRFPNMRVVIEEPKSARLTISPITR